MNHSISEANHRRPAPDVVALGESMLTLRTRRDQAAFEWEVSGAESNVARYCAAFGLQTAWVSQVGTDLAGDLVLSVIEGAGVDVSGVRRLSDRPTGLMLKEATADALKVRYYRAGSAASAMAPPISAEVGRAPKILHLTGITLGLSCTCNQLIQSLIEDRSRSALISFDINWRPSIWAQGDPPNALREAANQCDIVFVGLDEANDLRGANTTDDVRTLLPQPETVVIKDAGNGAHADLGSRRYFVPALDGPVVQPIGAGDAFAAGFLVGVLRHDRSVEAALRLGHIAAMSALSQHNDVGPLAEDATIQHLLDLSPEDWLSASLDPTHTHDKAPVPHSLRDWLVDRRKRPR